MADGHAQTSPGALSPDDELYAVIYAELRHIAAQHVRKEPRGNSLSPTSLAHEAYLRLVHEGILPESHRVPFCIRAAQAMRRILVEHARRRFTRKRGGKFERRLLQLDAVVLADKRPTLDLLALEEALQELERLDPRRAEVVHLRYFGGLSEQEVADIFGVAAKTVARDWASARAWLLRALSERSSGAA